MALPNKPPARLLLNIKADLPRVKLWSYSVHGIALADYWVMPVKHNIKCGIHMQTVYLTFLSN